MHNVKNWESIPIANIGLKAFEFEKLQSQKIYELIRKSNLGPVVQFHKHKLGKQNYCWTRSKKYWVWEKDNWRIFVANGFGISFEVKKNLSETKAINKFKEYLNLIGIKT